MRISETTRSILEQHIAASVNTAAQTPASFHAEGLGGCTPGLWYAEWAATQSRPLVVVAEDYATMRSLASMSRAFGDSGRIACYPHRDVVAYDESSPTISVTAERIATLAAVAAGDCALVLTTVAALIQKVAPKAVLLKAEQQLQVGQHYKRDALITALLGMGYVRVDLVEEAGEFTVKGEMIDIFPANTQQPYRLIFFDVELEQIKTFRISDQHSLDTQKELLIYPVYECLPSAQTEKTAKRLRQHKPGSDPAHYDRIAQAIDSGLPFGGSERYLPLLFESTSILTDYFAAPPCIIHHEQEKVFLKYQNLWDEVCAEYEIARNQLQITPDPQDLFVAPHEWEALQNKWQPMRLSTEFVRFGKQNIGLHGNDQLAVALNSQITPTGGRVQNATQIIVQLHQLQQSGAAVSIATGSLSQAENIRHIIADMQGEAEIISLNTDTKGRDPDIKRQLLLGNTSSSILIVVCEIPRGFRATLPDGSCIQCLITGEDIFGPKVQRRRQKKSAYTAFGGSIEDLKVGDFVVHVEYGIGEYKGIESITIEEQRTDFLKVGYSGGDNIYVPVDQAHLLQKFDSLEGATPQLNSLSDNKWKRTKARAAKAIHDMADELIALYSQRKLLKGTAFSANTKMYDTFALNFPYQETEDQEQAIKDCMADLESEQPMDRLICGDVGFGKTEVALRAACKVAADGYQVALLAPTTILAQQHFKTFCDRFADFPMNIGLASRFQKGTELRRITEELAAGTLDILIGTHKLLSKTFKFANLGLLIIDEEQRFGVRHKEQIKQISTLVDTLTLSATPIPRTLHFSLIGVRDISVINTPPMDRRAIRTRVLKFDEYLLKEAVERECRRNGQVYFVHNNVQSIYHIADHLKRILPSVSLAVAHGQMSKTELEDVMLAFIAGKFTLLLTTTIIESGIDIPNANTMIVNNAHCFGLSQLYQLRGRIGRSNRQAYAYLLTPEGTRLKPNAEKRLRLLQELTELGSGFKIASHDLELRGSGNVLGAEQSGHIIGVGIEMYMSLLEEAVAKLKNKQTPEAEHAESCEAQIGFQAYLPEDYIPVAGQRLATYKDISRCKNLEDLHETRGSVLDRFGAPPPAAQALFDGVQLKLVAQSMGVVRLQASTSELVLELGKHFTPDPLAAVLALGQMNGFFKDSSTVIFRRNFATARVACQFLQEFYEACSAENRP